MAGDTEHHPMRLAALAVGATLTLCTAIFFTWIIPTMTASLNFEVALTKEKLATAVAQNAVLVQRSIDQAKISEEQAATDKARIVSLSSEEQALRAQLFAVEMANVFLLGNPYPIGLDKVRVGDPKSKVSSVFEVSSIAEKGSLIAVKTGSALFRHVRYQSFSEDAVKDRIASIEFDLGEVDRILDRSLPKIPKGWLEQTLRRVLGDPKIIGSDNDCLLWKFSGDQLVYYRPPADSFDVSGYQSYPAGCNITREQLKRYGSNPSNR